MRGELFCFIMVNFRILKLAELGTACNKCATKFQKHTKTYELRKTKTRL